MHAHTRFEPPEVTVGGAPIPAAEIAAEIQHHPAGSAETAWHAAAEALVVRRLLLDEAARQGISDGDDEARVQALLDRELRVPEADEATCRRWYEANRAKLRPPPSWEAAHLLLAADPSDAAARGAARARAEAALAECKADPNRLAVLAPMISECPSRDAGGLLGWVEEGTTVPEFERALRATPPGHVHGEVVETRFGFHVLRAGAHHQEPEPDFAEARALIAAHLREASFRRAARQYIALLAAKAGVGGIVLSAAADGPLVQ